MTKISDTVFVNGVASKVFYVEKLSGKAVRGAGGMVEFAPDRRLKVENQAADLEVKRAKFTAEADDLYFVSDFELAFVDITSSYNEGEMVEGQAVTAADLVANASELPKKLKTIVDLASVGRIVLIGEDIDVVQRNILRYFMDKADAIPRITFRDLRAKLVFDEEWKKLSDIGRRSLYYKDRTKLEFYQMLAQMFTLE